ncbi:MAG: YgjV family protein [Ardenticatenaceae bacterium]|nr:YgjV family protein [Ardenticatenaceae bacterium]
MQIYLELLGYLASVLVAISLMMSSVLKLRLINLVGAIAFFIYGLLIGAYPIAAVNAVIIVVNLYFLYRIFSSKEYFKLLEVSSGSAYLQYFLDFYKAEIEKFIPDYRFAPSEKQLIIFVLRDMVPAGLFIGEPQENGEFRVFLDFVIPSYRDFKIGKYLYEQSRFFRQHGIRKLMSTPHNNVHASYLKRMGFQPETDEAGNPVCSLTIPA